MGKFVHLHLHTQYSLLDGSIKIDELMDKVKDSGMDSVAITDHGAMFGVVEFYKAAKAKGIKPIIGCEVYVTSTDYKDKSAEARGEYNHLILLAENDKGYHNLMKIVSESYVNGFYYKPRIDDSVLRLYSEGIIATSACIGGEVAQRLLERNIEAAQSVCERYIDIFGADNFYLELQDHGMREQKIVNDGLLELSTRLDLPLIATNDAHYLNADDAKVHDVLLCIQTGKTVTDENRMKFPSEEFYVKTPEEMEVLFAHFPGALENTVKIAERCNVELDFENIHLPRYFVPEGYTNVSYLRKLVSEGLAKRYEEITEEISARAEYELTTIETMGYVDYFLIVWDFIHYAVSNKIAVGPGRGSAAGSIIAYALEITGVDPLKYDLLFERFLNPERVTMPDIDIDFCYERREEVINYVVEKYGHDHVAQIVTFGTMAARAAIRDVGRALGMPLGKVDQVAKLVPQELNMTLTKALEISKELVGLVDTDDDVKRLINYAKRVEGLMRHTSTHAAGVLISKEPVTEFVPLARNKDIITTQFNMVELEELGLLKMDFLGLRTLTVIRDALDMIESKYGIQIDFASMSTDDEKIFKMFQNAETLGIFQFESAGMRAFLKELKPTVFEDLVAANALFRPGPMNQIPTFIANKHDESKIEYIHQSLEHILDVTYGCIVYQEQVMQIVRDIGGYSFGRADLVRRAMSKKKMSVMEEERRNFIFGQKDEQGNVIIKGAIANGVDEESAQEIYDLMIDFANYAFNKSHSVAYAYVAYQTAYLKEYYPVEFMAALISSLMGNKAQVANYIVESKRLGINVLSPHINHSHMKFTVEENAIRFGLLAVKNVGTSLIDAIVAERKNGNYKSFKDFVKRVNSSANGVLNKKAIENLIRVGAFDGLGANRAQLLFCFESVIDSVISESRRNIEGQFSLFELSAPKEKDGYESDMTYPIVDELPKEKILEIEKEVLGIYLSGHPLDGYEVALERSSDYTTLDLIEMSKAEGGSALKDGMYISIGGIVVDKRELFTKKNDLMAFIKLEDLVSTIEVIAFPRVYSGYKELLSIDGRVIIRGRLSLSDVEEPKLIAEKVEALSEVQASSTLYLKLDKYDNSALKRILDICGKYKGNDKVYIYIAEEKRTLEAPREFFIDLSYINDLKLAFEELLGQGCAIVK